MFHVKHPAALGAVAAHQEEVRAGSSSRFALRTLRPAPSSPAPARDPRTQRASAQQAQPRIISRREARTDFKDPSATFSTSWQASGSKTIFRMIDRLQPIEKLLENPWSALSAASSTCHEVEKVAEKLDFSTRAARAGGWQKDPCHPSTLHMKHPAVVAGGTRRRRDAPKRNAPPQDRRAIR